MKLWHLYLRFLKLIIRWAISLEDTAGAIGALFAGAVVVLTMLSVMFATGVIFGFQVSPGRFVFPLEITIAYFLLIFLPLLPAVFFIWQIASESLLHTLGITGLLGRSGDKIRVRLSHWSRKAE